MQTRILQITSGRGPQECCWVVSRVLKFLLEEARSLGLHAHVIHREEGEENGTLLSAVVQVKGNDLKGFVQSWVGTVLWIGKSKYRKMHKRSNWFVGVNLLQPAATGFTEFNVQDVRYEAFRSGGPGGQNVNKVNSAVRAIHIPTGINVVAKDTRSQVQNKKLAFDRLAALVRSNFIKQQEGKIYEGWKNHELLVRGNPVRVFTGDDFKKMNVEKKYKSRRLSLKQELRKEIRDD
ncbi:MAG: peptide chain release factor H [Cytophagaceae bacterium]